jgi:hypothetical protein
VRLTSLWIWAATVFWLSSSQAYRNLNYPCREGDQVAQRFESGSSGLFGAEPGGTWKAKLETVRQYRAVWLGCRLLCDEGVMRQWKFRGDT